MVKSVPVHGGQSTPAASTLVITESLLLPGKVSYVWLNLADRWQNACTMGSAKLVVRASGPMQPTTSWLVINGTLRQQFAAFKPKSIPHQQSDETWMAILARLLRIDAQKVDAHWKLPSDMHELQPSVSSGTHHFYDKDKQMYLVLTVSA